MRSVVTAILFSFLALTQPAPQQPDADKDGIPDDWEKQYGFNPNDPADAKADPDKDGCDNLCEFLAGTDPIDTTPPTVGDSAATGTFDTVTIAFSEELDATSATDITPGALRGLRGPSSVAAGSSARIFSTNRNL